MPGCFHCSAPGPLQGPGSRPSSVSSALPQSFPPLRCRPCNLPLSPRPHTWAKSRDGSLAAPSLPNDPYPRPLSLLTFPSPLPGASARRWMRCRASMVPPGPPLRGLGLHPKHGMSSLAHDPMRRHRTRALMRQPGTHMPAEEPWCFVAMATQRLTAHSGKSLSTPAAPAALLARGDRRDRPHKQALGPPMDKRPTATTGRLD
ncbi:hypothetical protein D3C86_1667600 [compost metagenome]